MASDEEMIAEGWRKVPIVLHDLGKEPEIIGHSWVKGEGGGLEYDQVLRMEVLNAVRNAAGDRAKIPVTVHLSVPERWTEMHLELPDGPESPRWTWYIPED